MTSVYRLNVLLFFLRAMRIFSDILIAETRLMSNKESD